MQTKKIIFKGRIFNLIKESRLLPNGHISNLEFLSHPGATLIIPFISSEKIIILKQFRPVINSYLYELPAGTREKNESYTICAKREIIEETGYAAKTLKKIGFIYPVPGCSSEKIVIFKATNLYQKNLAKDKDEIISTIIVSKKDIKKLLSKGKLVDAKTISALVLCNWL